MDRSIPRHALNYGPSFQVTDLEACTAAQCWEKFGTDWQPEPGPRRLATPFPSSDLPSRDRVLPSVLRDARRSRSASKLVYGFLFGFLLAAATDGCGSGHGATPQTPIATAAIGTTLMICGVWLLIGMAAVHRKLQNLNMLHMVAWRDAFAVLLLVVFWPVLVVF